MSWIKTATAIGAATAVGLLVSSVARPSTEASQASPTTIPDDARCVTQMAAGGGEFASGDCNGGPDVLSDGPVGDQGQPGGPRPSSSVTTVTARSNVSVPVQVEADWIGSMWGDTHVTSLDGYHYDFQ